MSVIVRVPTILRSYTGGEAEVSGEGATLRDVINDIETRNTGISARILDENGKIRRFVNVYVNEEDVRFEQGLDTPTPAGTTISVLAAVAGG
ncbi:MAG: MoaD/ThiS family protein [Micrococcales bacterium]